MLRGARAHDAHRHRQLSDVPHRVFSSMHETSDHRGRKLRSSDGAELAERRDFDRLQLVDRGIDARMQRRQHVANVSLRDLAAFRAQPRELRVVQRLATGIGEESVDDARHVSHMKRRRRNAGGSCVPLSHRQAGDELIDTLADLKQDVRNRLQQSRNLRDRTALPPLGISHSIWALKVIKRGMTKLLPAPSDTHGTCKSPLIMTLAIPAWRRHCIQVSRNRPPAPNLAREVLMRVRLVSSVALLALPMALSAQVLPRVGRRPTPEPAPLPPTGGPIARSLELQRSRWTIDGYSLFSNIRVPAGGGVANYAAFGGGTHDGYRFADRFTGAGGGAAARGGSPI